MPRKDATSLKIQNAHKELQKKNIRAGRGIITVNTTGVSPPLINQKAVFNEQLKVSRSRNKIVEPQIL